MNYCRLGVVAHMSETEWFWKYLQRSPAHPPITLPYTSPGHAPFSFPFLIFYSLFLFPSCLENLDCLTYHPQTPRNRAVESCGRGCACTGFAVVNYLNRAEGGCTHLQFLFLFCPACGRDVGVYEAGTAWSCSPSTNLTSERAVRAFFLTTPDAGLVTRQAPWLPT